MSLAKFMKKTFDKTEVSKIIESKNYNALMNYDFAGADFRSIDLTGADLSHLNLEGAIFDGMKLNGVNFDGASLDNASFVETDCACVNFYGSWMRNVDFSKALIEECCFSYAKLEDASFDFVKASITDFSHIWARKVSFRNANLYACNFGPMSILWTQKVELFLSTKYMQKEVLLKQLEPRLQPVVGSCNQEHYGAFYGCRMTLYIQRVLI